MAATRQTSLFRTEATSIFAFPYRDEGSERQLTALPRLPGKRKKPDESDEEPSDGDDDIGADDRDTVSDEGQQPYLLRGTQVRQVIAKLNPPLHLPLTPRERGPRGQRPSVKKTQVKVLSALMHRCLREGDFARAGRAFSLLLHTEYRNKHVDLRMRGLYGVGAEILLRQAAPNTKPVDRDRDDDLEETSRERPARSTSVKSLYSREGFKAAKAYYERLAIEFPQSRTPGRPKISAPHFYAVMYGLWISTAQDEYRDAMEAATAQRDAELDGDDKDKPVDGSSCGANFYRSTNEAAESLRSEATSIRESLAELMLSPPYSESEYLKELQTLVRQWVRDVSRRVSQAAEVLGAEAPEEFEGSPADDHFRGITEDDTGDVPKGSDEDATTEGSVMVRPEASTEGSPRERRHSDVPSKSVTQSSVSETIA